jgi:hypothetical protein
MGRPHIIYFRFLIFHFRLNGNGTRRASAAAHLPARFSNLKSKI